MNIFALTIIFFAISLVGVSTGGLSLITVPLLIFSGLSPSAAIATNMLGLVFISLSGAAGFFSELKKIKFSFIVKLSLISAGASFMGARLVLLINEDVLRIIIVAVILTVTLLFFFYPDLGINERHTAKRRRAAGWGFVFILGVYGGFFSGAYITMLTYVFLIFWGMTFLKAAALTKVLNFFSSAAASCYFISSGAIDFSYALPLATAMLAGGYLGARTAVLKGNNRLRHLFLGAALLLGIIILFFN